MEERAFGQIWLRYELDQEEEEDWEEEEWEEEEEDEEF